MVELAIYFQPSKFLETAQTLKKYILRFPSVLFDLCYDQKYNCCSVAPWQLSRENALVCQTSICL